MANTTLKVSNYLLELTQLNAAKVADSRHDAYRGIVRDISSSFDRFTCLLNFVLYDTAKSVFVNLVLGRHNPRQQLQKHKPQCLLP